MTRRSDDESGSSAGFTQKPRRAWIIGQFPADHLERDDRIQHRIASAIRYCHRAGAECDRNPIVIQFHFEMSVTQRSGDILLRRERPTQHASQALAIRAELRQRVFAFWTNPDRVCLDLHF